jgi:hypothetical protein
VSSPHRSRSETLVEASCCLHWNGERKQQAIESLSNLRLVPRTPPIELERQRLSEEPLVCIGEIEREKGTRPAKIARPTMKLSGFRFEDGQAGDTGILGNSAEV